MRRTRKGTASRSRNPECRLESGSVSSRGAGRRSRLQVQIPASEHESATVPTPGFCGSQIISYFCRCLPRGRLRPDGGIGRHAGLKILWPAMAVPVRSRLRVPTKIPDDFNGRLGFLLLVRGRGPRARSRAAANRRSATNGLFNQYASGRWSSCRPTSVWTSSSDPQNRTRHARRPQSRQFMCRASIKRLIVSGLPVCLPSSSLILHVSL